MKCWQVQQLRLVRSTATSQETFEAVVAEANRLGFEYCSFGMKAPVPLGAPRVLWCSNYPEQWRAHYERNDYLRRDPTVAHAIISDEPLLWSEEVFADCPELLRDARAHGLSHGFAVPHHDAKGMVSLTSFVRSEPPIGSDELESKRERLLWLAHICHEGMLRVWNEPLLGAESVDLSGRELEVLRWTSDGKTAADIAQLLNISEATVNFHTRNACMKLGTSNKTSAAVRAALMGLLL